MTEIKTLCVRLSREIIDDATAHWIVAEKIRKASQFAEVLQVIWEQVTDIFALEVYCHRQYAYLCFTTVAEAVDQIASSLYFMIPSAHIVEIPDFTESVSENDHIVTAEMRTKDLPILPFLTYEDRQYDSFSPLMNILSVLPAENKMIVQWVLQAIPDDFKLNFKTRLQQIEWLASFPFRPLYWVKPGVIDKFNKGASVKMESPLFKANVRMAVIAPVPEGADREERAKIEKRSLANLKAGLVGLKFYHNTNMGSFKKPIIRTGMRAFLPFQERDLSRPFMLSQKEVATMWHPLFISKQPNLAQILSRRGSPPADLPNQQLGDQVSIFGRSSYRSLRELFGIMRQDREKHIHILGKSGSGKSKLIELFAKSDIEHGHGLAIIDCHGDLVTETLRFVPESRVDDVVILDVSDIHYPPSFNVFEGVLRSQHEYVASEFLDMFKKLEGAELTDSAEQVLRNVVLALLAVPDTSVVCIFRMLTDEEYRDSIIAQLQEGSVKDFWKGETDDIEALLEQPDIFQLTRIIARLVSSNVVSNILGQRENRFDFGRFIEEGKIILVKVPKQNLGKQNSVLLGTMVLSMINLAATSRVNQQSGKLKDFYVYVDEFQNFATESFSKVLNSAAKNRVSYTVAHQMIKQLPESVRETLAARVGNVISFQVGGEDALVLRGRLAPFDNIDLMNLNIRSFYIRMGIRGEQQEAFSGQTIDVVYPEEDFVDRCIERSRAKYCRLREEVIDEVLPFEAAADPGKAVG